MKSFGFAIVIVAAALRIAAPALAQSEKTVGQGRAIVTVLPKHGDSALNITQQSVSVKVNGKDSSVTGWVPLRDANDGLELVVLLDSGAINLGHQLDEVKNFILGQGPHTKVAIGYMHNNLAGLAGPLSVNHAEVAGKLHLPGGASGNSPYLSLSDLANHWPSDDRGARREVVLMTDGVDPYKAVYDSNNVQVQGAIADSLRAGLVVYTIYWSNTNAAVATETTDSTNIAGSVATVGDAGQNYMIDLIQATGGNDYRSGNSNPVALKPFFNAITRSFENQYLLLFSSPLSGKPAVESLKLKIGWVSGVVTAPQKVFVNLTVSAT